VVIQQIQNLKKVYKIKKYTLEKAKRLGVSVKPSKVDGKKIDVYKNGKRIASVGGLGYNDYPTYLELEKMGKVPKGYAEKRRKQYKIRHKKDRTIRGSNGWYADQLLW
jgi:hypothetical protein